MARIRSIKPEVVDSESLSRVSREARLFFILLWTLADDFGRARASSRFLASRLYPYDDDALGLIDGWLKELARERHIRLYAMDGSRYLEIVNWLKHQKIDHPTKSKLPEPPRISDEFAKASEILALDQGSGKDQGSGEDQDQDSPDGVVACATNDDADRAFTLFNDSAKRTGWPKAQKIDADRKKAMRCRLREVGGIDGFAVALGKAEASEFLTVTWPNFNIDWMLKPKNFRKLMEGNYDKRDGHEKQSGLGAVLAELGRLGAGGDRPS